MGVCGMLSNVHRARLAPASRYSAKLRDAGRQVHHHTPRPLALAGVSGEGLSSDKAR